MDADKIAKLQRGEMPIYEPHLTELLREASARGGIEFTTELAPAAAESDVIFIAVGTPPRPSGEANLSYLESAARSIGAAMDGERFRVVVNKSTVPVGCGNLVETLLREGMREAHPNEERRIRFGVASNPEFLREGCAISDSLYPADRAGGRGRANHGHTARSVRASDHAIVRGAVLSAAAGEHDASGAGGHDAHQRRDDQVRRQHVSGDEDRLR
jgi:nucleotide sugar dehydrogenase